LWLAFIGTKYIFEQFGTRRRPIEPIGNRAIWYTSLDSREPRKLPDSHVSDSYPTWSPDATMIAFQANRRGLGYSILVADRETGATFQLNPDSLDAFTPDWSPDGTRIAYAYRNRNSGRRGIATTTVDGLTSQTMFDTSGIDVSYPVWSRAGDKIAFKSGSQRIIVISLSGEIINEIYPIVVKPYWIPDDSGLIEPKSSKFRSLEIFSLIDSSIAQLTPVDAAKSDADIAWFPDSQRLAFARYDTLSKSYRIYTISRDGSDIKPLNASITSGDERNPAISPDGKWLIYDVGNELFLQPLSGGEPLGLGEYVGSGFIDAYWGPNSDAIVCRNSRNGALTVFSTDSTLVVNRIDLGYAGSSVCWSAIHEEYGSHIAVGSRYIFKIRPDGSEVSVLIDPGGEPSWSPDATQLAFIRNGQVHIMQVFGAF